MGFLSTIGLAHILFETAQHAFFLRGVLRRGSFAFSKQKPKPPLSISVMVASEEQKKKSFSDYRRYKS